MNIDRDLYVGVATAANAISNVTSFAIRELPLGEVEATFHVSTPREEGLPMESSVTVRVSAAQESLLPFALDGAASSLSNDGEAFGKNFFERVLRNTGVDVICDVIFDPRNKCVLREIVKGLPPASVPTTLVANVISSMTPEAIADVLIRDGVRGGFLGALFDSVTAMTGEQRLRFIERVRFGLAALPPSKEANDKAAAAQDSAVHGPFPAILVPTEEPPHVA